MLEYKCIYAINYSSKRHMKIMSRYSSKYTKLLCNIQIWAECSIGTMTSRKNR